MSSIKVNGFGVAQFAKNKTTVDKEGVLLKKGGTNPALRSRFFVLKGNLLFYYKSIKDRFKEPIGFICLEDYDIEYDDTDSSSKGQSFRLQSGHSKQKEFSLTATNFEEAESWVEALRLASYDFIRNKCAYLESILKSNYIKYQPYTYTDYKGKKHIIESDGGVPMTSVQSLGLGDHTGHNDEDSDDEAHGYVLARGVDEEKEEGKGLDSELSEWLNINRLEMYASNLSSGSVSSLNDLKKLTEADFKRLDIKPGHRKKFKLLIDKELETEPQPQSEYVVLSGSKVEPEKVPIQTEYVNVSGNEEKPKKETLFDKPEKKTSVTTETEYINISEPEKEVKKVAEEKKPQDYVVVPDVGPPPAPTAPKPADNSSSRPVVERGTKPTVPATKLVLQPKPAENAPPVATNETKPPSAEPVQNGSHPHPHHKVPHAHLPHNVGGRSPRNSPKSSPVSSPKVSRHAPSPRAERKVVQSMIVTEPVVDKSPSPRMGRKVQSMMFENSDSPKGGLGGALDKCHVCAKTVYAMEKLVADHVVYHKNCFKCFECKKNLSLGGYASLGGKTFCKPHFKQLFKLKGNYDEGFGTEQHKTKWLKKTAEDDEGDVEEDSEI